MGKWCKRPGFSVLPTALSTPFAILFALLATPSNSNAALKFYENSAGSPVIKLIANAKKSVDIEIYEMKDEKVHVAIKEALHRGVKIRIIQEPTPVGNCFPFKAAASTDDATCASVKEFVAYVRSHGGTYVPFDKQLCGTPGARCFQHGKMVIVDGTKVLTSTGNFNASSLCDMDSSPVACNRDYSLVDDNQNVLKSFQAIFDQDLKGEAVDLGTILEQHGTQDTLTVSPTHTMDPLLNIIDSSKKLLVIENQYLKDATLNEAIVRAAKRGVKVYVMVSALCSFVSDPSQLSPSEVTKWKNTYSAFQKAGVITRIFTKKMTVNGMPGYLHAKAILADKKIAWVGSTNGSTTALTNNREFGTISSDSAVVSALYNVMVKDLNHEQSISWQEALTCKNDMTLAKQRI